MVAALVCSVMVCSSVSVLWVALSAKSIDWVAPSPAAPIDQRRQHGRDLFQRQDVVYCPQGHGLPGHAVHHAARLVLGNGNAAGRGDVHHASGTVTPHPCQQHPHRATPETAGCGVHGDSGRGSVAVTGGRLGEIKASVLVQYEVGIIGGEIDHPGLGYLGLGCRPYRQGADFGQPRHHRDQEACADVLHAHHRQGKPLGQMGEKRAQSLGAAGGGTDGHHVQCYVGAWPDNGLGGWPGNAVVATPIHPHPGQDTYLAGQFRAQLLQVALDDIARFGVDINRPCFQEPEDIGGARFHRHAHHQDRARLCGHDLVGEFQPIHHRHVEIGADDVGIQGGQQVESLLAVGGGAHHLDAG
ncbi:MAG: hypothetical protein PF442_07845 [Desulfobulbaceae bacterium]|nr:hypothetical protein [Desulfobulbaceae bacterium]